MCHFGSRQLSLIAIVATFLASYQVHGGDADRSYPWSSSLWDPSRDGPSVESYKRISWEGWRVVASKDVKDEGNASNADKSSTETTKGPSVFKYVKKKGRVSLNMSRRSTTGDAKRKRVWTMERIISSGSSSEDESSNNPQNPKEKDILSVSMDPFASIRLLQIIFAASSSLVAAFIGTLKLLGPLIFARRVLAQIGELVSDYMMGRYLRTTYYHVERKYWKYYQGPAASRSLGRCLCHMAILLQLGVFMENNWISLSSKPCVISGTGACHWWCGLLWILSVVGTGNIGAVLLSTRGPLAIKVSKSSVRRPPKRKAFARTLNYFQWMKDPDQWLTSIATSRRDNAKSWKPFTPEPLLFPSTFPLFNILRNFAVAKAMASTSAIVPNSQHIIMRQFLIQHAFMDEWHRVLMDERRVGLGIFAIAIGFIATSFLFVTVTFTDSISAVLMLPWLVATFSSGWMNLFCYWERRQDSVKQNLVVVPVLTNSGRHRRSMGSKKYQIKW